MPTSHFDARWISSDGELSKEPQTRLSLERDVIYGIERFARVFPPGEVSGLRIYIEGWENEICTRWNWTWDPLAFVGGVAYRYAFEGNWSKWSVSYADASAPGNHSDPMGGVSTGIKQYDVTFGIQVALLGLCGISRGPIVEATAMIPPVERISTQQPAMVLYEMSG